MSEKKSKNTKKISKSAMNEAMFDRICAELACTIDSLEKICISFGYESAKPFFRYLHKNADAISKYHKAREVQSDYVDDYLRDFISNPERLRMTRNKITGEEKVDTGYVNWMSVCTKHHQWRAGVMNANKAARNDSASYPEFKFTLVEKNE